MKIIRATIVPLELFERKLRTEFEDQLTKHTFLCEGYTGLLKRVFTELADDVPSVYQIQHGELNVIVAFHGSSACFVRFELITQNLLREEDILAELTKRRGLHRSIIASKTDIFGIPIPNASERYNIAPSYAFSYYLVDAHNEKNDPGEDLLKVLAEPSIIDLDDMISSDGSSSKITPTVLSTVSSLQDCDIAADSSAYITWASILAISRSDPSSFLKMVCTITALEMRLQMAWNRCFMLSNLADAILAKKFAPKNFQSFYWEIVRAFDDARGVLASTSSTRVNTLFETMVRTSNLLAQISRLENKILLCEKFTAATMRQEDAKYRKLVEILLFLVALSQLAPIMFSLPVDYFKDRATTSIIIIGVILLLGLCSILIRNRD